MTLSGSSTGFTGTINVDGGTLALAAGKSLNATEFNVAADRTLEVVNGNSIATAGALNMTAGSNLTLNMTGATNAGTVLTLAAGTLNFGGGGKVVVNAINTTGLEGTYTVIDSGTTTFDFAGKYDGKINGQAGSSTGPNIRYGMADYDATEIGKLLLHVTESDINRQATWTDAAGTGLWNETDNNWDLDGSNYHVFKKGDAPVFGDTGAGRQSRRRFLDR